jgi:hypothetical protein
VRRALRNPRKQAASSSLNGIPGGSTIDVPASNRSAAEALTTPAPEDEAQGRMNFFASIRFRCGRWLMLRHIQRNQRAFVRRAESNPWIHEYRAVKAEVERTGDDSLFADFERRFKQAERERWGPRDGP